MSVHLIGTIDTIHTNKFTLLWNDMDEKGHVYEKWESPICLKILFKSKGKYDHGNRYQVGTVRQIEDCTHTIHVVHGTVQQNINQLATTQRPWATPKKQSSLIFFFSDGHGKSPLLMFNRWILTHTKFYAIGLHWQYSTMPYILQISRQNWYQFCWEYRWHLENIDDIVQCSYTGNCIQYIL